MSVMKIQKNLVLALIITFLITGTTAGAATGMNADELRAEIARLSRVAESIRAQLLKYGSDPSTVVPGTTTTPGSYTGTACLQTNLQMKQGTTGGSVSTLQQFLAQQGVYSASLVTGYFGPATQAGVQKWQATHSVVAYGTPATTGYGKVGPATLRAMHAGCSGGTYTGPSGSLTGATTGSSSGTGTGTTTTPKKVPVEKYTLSLNPTRGLAPMSVTVDFSITGSTCTSYMLDWGDNSLPISYNSNKSTDCIPLPIKITRTHIYNTTGTHTVRFKNGKAPITEIREVSDLKVEVIGTPSTSY